MKRALQEHGGASDHREDLIAATEAAKGNQNFSNRVPLQIRASTSERASMALTYFAAPSVLTGGRVPRGMRETAQPGGTSDYKAALIAASLSARAWKPKQE